MTIPPANYSTICTLVCVCIYNRTPTMCSIVRMFYVCAHKNTHTHIHCTYHMCVCVAFTFATRWQQ